jgi:phage FluMu protein Com
VSYLQSRIRCEACLKVMNAVFSRTQIAGWPVKCPHCGGSAFTKIPDGWDFGSSPSWVSFSGGPPHTHTKTQRRAGTA